MSSKTSSLDVQVGGSHYKDCPIQPIEFIHANGLGYVEGAVVKYVTRWKYKNGVEDLKKARHFLDLLIELTEKANVSSVQEQASAVQGNLFSDLRESTTSPTEAHPKTSPCRAYEQVDV